MVCSLYCLVTSDVLDCLRTMVLDPNKRQQESKIQKLLKIECKIQKELPTKNMLE